MRRTRWILVWIIGVPFLGLALYLAFMTLTDYNPGQALALDIEANPAALLRKGESFSVVTFNIGYAGLDAGADFFMDGGSASRAGSLGQARANLERIAAFLSAARADLILLQEVDVRSSRSFRIDEADYLKKILAGHGAVFAVNYRVPWVPVPLFRPMGAVRSGLLTLFRFRVKAATRYRLPGREAWPRQLAELDRCLSESRLPVQGGKDLVLIHLHLSVFDQGGRIRKQQLAFLREHIMAEYGRGNHVIVGGDWNHGLPGTDPARFRWTEKRPGWYMALPGDFTPPGFTWAIDGTVPSIRSNGSAYRNGVNFVAVIDGFLVSPNVEIVRAVGHDLGFANSDHNPVAAVFRLK